MKKSLSGIHIQWPWSELILSGEKTVETRTYPLPEKYRGVELAVIETPGPWGRKNAGINRARIVGTVTFSDSFQYKSRSAWLKDRSRHKVIEGDPLYGWNDRKEKWGWVVSDFKLLKNHCPPPLKRGIIFASNCTVSG